MINSITTNHLFEELYSRGKRSPRTSLKQMQALMERLSHPERAFPSVHVAGTNGKGSVSLKIAKSLESTYGKVGLYSSPHLFSPEERIQINGMCIPRKRLNELLSLLADDSSLTFFDLMTAAAFLYFKEEKIDYAVIETGIGGRFDSTNVIIPTLSIITTIGFDHQEILGKSLKEIAFAKAGIIKPNVPALIGPRVNPLDFQFPDLYQVQGVFATFDEENQAIAKEALTILGEKIVPSALLAKPPGRAEERLFQGKRFFFDVAHNVEGISALTRHLTGKRYTVLFAAAANKEQETMIKLLAPYTEELLLLDLPALKNDATLDPFSPEKALTLSLQRANDVLVTGSFHTVSSILSLLSKESSAYNEANP